MGFFDTLAKAASSAVKAAGELNAESREYYERYRNCSKEELENKFRSSWASTAEKMAIAKIMKENGWRS